MMVRYHLQLEQVYAFNLEVFHTFSLFASLASANPAPWWLPPSWWCTPEQCAEARRGLGY
jgi:hypothetical protein